MIKKTFFLLSQKTWLIIFLTSLIIKLLIITDNNIAFTSDQARDMLEIRHLVITGNPKLIGPITDILGLYLGPFWYYFNLPPFLLSGGNPIWLVYWQIFWFHFSIFIFYLLAKKLNKTFALIGSILLLISPIGFLVNRFSFNANAIVFVTIIYFSLQMYFLQKPKKTTAIFLGFITGIALQTQAAFGILLFPFSFLCHWKYSQIPKRFISFGFFITLIPQLLFEISHKFIMTKSFLNELSGKSNFLSSTGGLFGRIDNRYEQLNSLLNQSFVLSSSLGLIFFIIAIIYIFTSFAPHFLVLANKKISQIQNAWFCFSKILNRDTGWLRRWTKNSRFLWQVPRILGKDAKLVIFRQSRRQLLDSTTRKICFSLIFFLFMSFIFYFFYPYQLKDWYLYGLTVPMILFISTFLSYLLNHQSILRPFVITAMLLMIFISAQKNLNYLNEIKNHPSDDPSNLRNQLEVIDLVYRQANNTGFKVYNYLPSVYDYPYQYLFWWYGTKRYHYQPKEIAYLPNQPPYIKDNELFWTKSKELSQEDFTFLIVQDESQSPERTTSWLSNFNSLCLVSRSDLPWRVRVEAKQNCPPK